MNGCEERLRETERQLAEARATLKQVADKLLNFEATESNYLACEMEVLKEHPSVEFAGTVYGGLAAVMGRLAGMTFRITDIVKMVHETLGQETDDTISAPTIN